MATRVLYANVYFHLYWSIIIVSGYFDSHCKVTYPTTQAIVSNTTTLTATPTTPPTTTPTTTPAQTNSATTAEPRKAKLDHPYLIWVVPVIGVVVVVVVALFAGILLLRVRRAKKDANKGKISKSLKFTTNFSASSKSG